MARRARTPRAQGTTAPKRAESYQHPEATSLLRPDVGTQAEFRKKKPPQRYRYDSSLSPALDWDGQNPAREQGEALIRQILDADSIEQAKAAAEQLRALSRPFLNWAGKAERLSFDIPTLPLFVHERLSTKAILETLKGHKRDKQLSMFELFGDPQRPIHDQVLRAYEYPDNWVNRLILGDSLVVMNSLLRYESLGGQVPPPHPDSGEEGTQERSGAAEGGGTVSEPSRPDRLVGGKPVAIVFGPENGAVSEKLVYEAAREAYAKSYAHLYVIGFAIQPNARELVEKCEQVVGVPATYVQATPDLMMGDLLKNMRSSQIFSVCGLPEVRVQRLKSKVQSQQIDYQVELVGLDVFDPVTMEAVHRGGNDVPAWFLDTDYNGLCFHVSQAFFPRTAAWDDLKKALKGEYEDSVWEHLAGTTSAPFEAGEHGQIAIKVIDDRGNELLVVKSL